MTVLELIDELQQLPPHLEVIMSRDAEGNGFSPCSCVETAQWYYADTRWSGDIVSNPDGFADCVPAIVLWPCN